MTACLVCLRPTQQASGYHQRCLRELFQTSKPPIIDLREAEVNTAALAMVGRVSFSGIQRKLSAGLSADRRTLQVATADGRYLLKPHTDSFPGLPENEHLTMRLARLFRMDVPPCGLVSLADGSLAYLVRRFDRRADGSKVDQEDFCQLTQRPPAGKYNGSALLCARVIKAYAAQPRIALLRLFEQWVFVWWTANGDFHLKNMSLYAPDGRYQMTPVYDMLCTRLAIPNDQFAMSLDDDPDLQFSSARWETFARQCELRPSVFIDVLSRPQRLLHEAHELVDRSYLGEPARRTYSNILATLKRYTV